MNARRSQGFVMILVLAVLAVLVVAVAVLTAASKDLRYQTERTHLQACQQNLQASGRAWAKRPHAAPLPPGAVVILDANDLGAPHAELSLRRAADPNAPEPLVIHAACRRGRMTLRHDLPLPRP